MPVFKHPLGVLPLPFIEVFNTHADRTIEYLCCIGTREDPDLYFLHYISPKILIRFQIMLLPFHRR